MIEANTPANTPIAPRKENDVVIIKAFHALKIKTGTGGFDRRGIIQAEKRLSNSAALFPEIAAQDVVKIEHALDLIEQSSLGQEVLQTVMAAGVDLKAHSTMFQFPLVSQIAESLLTFCVAVKKMSPLVNDVISEHLKALKIAISAGPRAITPEDREVLLSGLEKACRKALRTSAN